MAYDEQRGTHVGKNISLSIENVNLIREVMLKEQCSFSQAINSIMEQWVLKTNIVSRLESEAHKAQAEVAMLRAQSGQVTGRETHENEE